MLKTLFLIVVEISVYNLQTQREDKNYAVWMINEKQQVMTSISMFDVYSQTLASKAIADCRWMFRQLHGTRPAGTLISL